MADWGQGAKGAATGGTLGAQVGGPWGAAIGGTAGGLLGLFMGGGKDKAIVPKDMQAMRQQQIQLLMSLLSPGAFDAGGAGSNFFYGAGGDKTQGLSTPEMDAYSTARPILEGMLTGTGPQFERDIAAANQQGGRFGSGNAIMRGEALRNLFNGRTQTANTLGALAGQAGSAQFDRASQSQNQRLQLLAGLLGMGGQASLSLPVQEGQDGFGDMGEIIKLIASMQGMKGGGSPSTKAPNSKMPTVQPSLMNQSFNFNA